MRNVRRAPDPVAYVEGVWGSSHTFLVRGRPGARTTYRAIATEHSDRWHLDFPDIAIQPVEFDDGAWTTRAGALIAATLGVDRSTFDLLIEVRPLPEGSKPGDRRGRSTPGYTLWNTDTGEPVGDFDSEAAALDGARVEIERHHDADVLVLQRWPETGSPEYVASGDELAIMIETRASA